MKRLITVRPTASYELTLPSDVNEDKDERVTSYWRPGEEALLQLSSYRRIEGPQVSAHERLQARLSRENLAEIHPEPLAPDSCLDAAAASGVDKERYRWIYCYAVWPDLALLITISGGAEDLATQGQWALDAVRSVRPVNG